MAILIYAGLFCLTRGRRLGEPANQLCLQPTSICFRNTGVLKSVGTLKHAPPLPSLRPRAKQNSPALVHQRTLIPRTGAQRVGPDRAVCLSGWLRFKSSRCTFLSIGCNENRRQGPSVAASVSPASTAEQFDQIAPWRFVQNPQILSH